MWNSKQKSTLFLYSMDQRLAMRYFLFVYLAHGIQKSGQMLLHLVFYLCHIFDMRSITEDTIFCTERRMIVKKTAVEGWDQTKEEESIGQAGTPEDC